MKHKSTCFISYCHSDIDRDYIDYFVNALRRANKTTDIFYDQQIGVGKPFKNFMQLLDAIDLVVMVCSPEYKQKASLGAETGGGVGYEYSLIKQRYSEIFKEKKEKANEFLSERNYNPFEVLPIIFKGTFQDSLPVDFKDNKSIDLSYFKLQRKKHDSGARILTLPQKISKQFENDVDKIIATLKANYRQKQKKYEEEVQKNYDLLKLDMLFKDTKSDFNNPEYSLNEYEDTLFVRTDVYKQIENQSAYIIVGRKGSGKSAITQVLPIRSKKYSSPYFGIIDVYANRDINLNILYSFVNKEFISDSNHVFDRLKCFRFGWELFFRLCIMELIAQLYNKDKLSSYNKKKAQRMKDIIDDLFRKNETSNEDTKNILFTYSFNSIQTFMNKCINESRRDERYFMSDIQAQFNLNHFIAHGLGKNTVTDLNEFIENLPGKFLITFDGFDTEIERFREQGQYYENDSLYQKVSFEIDWLHSLLLTVNDIKQLRKGKEVLDNKLDFCITIPNHRYLEIIRNDIDSYRFQHRRKNLIWSGMELALFLKKRLENLSNSSYKGRAFEALSKVLKDKFAYIPENVEFDFNGKKITMSLFLYVLRHTFWRPRDILLYYAHIISLCRDYKDSNEIVSTETLRTNIANLTFEIIKDDFKNEYKGTIRNLGEILEVFNRAQQVLSFEDVEERLFKVDFEFVIADIKVKHDTIEKIKFLYQIGFLGIKADQYIRDKYNLFSHDIFMFNEGCKPLKKANREKLKEYTFVIHPLFCEYLELDTRNNDFVLNYSSKYIMEIEGYMKASNEDFDCA